MTYRQRAPRTRSTRTQRFRWQRGHKWLERPPILHVQLDFRSACTAVQSDHRHSAALDVDVDIRRVEARSVDGKGVYHNGPDLRQKGAHGPSSRDVMDAQRLLKPHVPASRSIDPSTGLRPICSTTTSKVPSELHSLPMSALHCPVARLSTAGRRSGGLLPKVEPSSGSLGNRTVNLYSLAVIGCHASLSTTWVSQKSDHRRQHPHRSDTDAFSTRDHPQAPSRIQILAP